MAATTPGQLYDRMHARFGIGSFDELTAKKQWWQIRNVEVSKIKAMMKKRKVSMAELEMTLDWLIETGRPITESWQLFDAVYDAKKAERDAAKTAATDVRSDLTAAAAEAMDQGEMTWAARLYNASDDAGTDVLNQWRSRT